MGLMSRVLRTTGAVAGDGLGPQRVVVEGFEFEEVDALLVAASRCAGPVV